MNAGEVATGLYMIVLILCVCCMVAGIIIIIRSRRDKFNKVGNENDFLHINAKVIGSKSFDTIQYTDIYDEVGYTEGVKIRYTVEGKSFEKISADMNFDDVVPIFVRRDNPDEFHIDLEKEELENQEEEFSSHFFVGVGLTAGGLVAGAFFLWNYLILIS